MLCAVRRGGLYAIGMAGLLIAGILAWRTWPQTSAGSFDPVSAVIGIASLVVGIASLVMAARAQRQADTDVAAIAARLAVAVEDEETKARQQLLGGDNRTINVRFAFQSAPGQQAAGAGRAGTLEQIVEYYRKLQPQRMVITGAAGSGKTVLAIELMLGLLKDRPADAPVPVRISAASLDTSRPVPSVVAEWITKHLTQAYKMPDAAARELVAARMVLPILDGLDEMDSAEAPAYASRAGQAIRACNAYLDGRQKAAMVLTCRISQYEALEQAREWIRDAARIQLHPVAVPAARRFLTARITDEDRWQPVLDRMQQRGSPLAQAMSTPWRLTVAATVYDQRDPATGSYLRDPVDLIGRAMDTEERIRDHLLGLYITAVIATNGSRYPAPHVHRWLGVLARYLNANTASPTQAARVIAGRPLSGTDLVLHEMWPVAGTRLPRILTAGVMSTLLLAIITADFTTTALSGWPLRQTTFFAFLVIVAAITMTSAFDAWPKPILIDPQLIITKSGMRKLPLSVVVMLVAGLAVGLVLGLVAGLAVGLVLGLVAGLMVAGQIDTDKYSVAKPGEIIRVNLVVGLVAGLAVALVIGLADGLAGRLASGLVGGLVGGLVTGFAAELAGMRYIALLLCVRRWTKHWLPWRLGKFMHWCYQAGIFRIAGIGYQFRHKELLDYLARSSNS